MLLCFTKFYSMNLEILLFCGLITFVFKLK